MQPLMHTMSMARFDRPDDSLDLIEHSMAMEEALLDKICTDERLSLDQREQLIRDILDRPDRDEFWNDDDASAILVRKLGPNRPRSQSGVAVCPEVERDEILEDNPELRAPRPHESSG